MDKTSLSYKEIARNPSKGGSKFNFLPIDIIRRRVVVVLSKLECGLSELVIWGKIQMSVLSNITAELLEEVMKMVGVEFIIDPEKILKVLTDSKDHKTAIALAATPLGPDYYITAADEIVLGENGSEIMVTLKPYDITGYIFPRNKLLLSEIKAVSPFRSRFENPYLKVAHQGPEVA